MTSGDASRDCSNCGATSAARSARFCEYCGTEFASPTAVDPTATAPDLPARFRALEQHDSFGRLMAHTPVVKLPARTNTALLVLVLLVIGLAGLFLSATLFFLCAPLGVLPLALVGVAIFFVVKQMAERDPAQAGPLERRPALVLEERTSVANVQGGMTGTRHFTTLEFAEGARGEFSAMTELAAQLTAGDLGVAYLQGRWLVAFERVPV